MDTNYKESIDFLQRWQPDGPWVLTAITLDKRSVITATLVDQAAVLKWLEKFGVDRNIYFSVNPTRYTVSKKPMREDVESLAWLHVDVDPRAGENIETEQERVLNLLQNPPEPIPKPTAIVFSGGGYQGFWKLKEPKEIKGRESAYNDAARYNQALEVAFGADPCHNVDRIMRVPGTINRPDKRKLEKGRVPTLARLIEFHDDRVYPLNKFAQASPVQTEAKGFASNAVKVEVSENVKRVDDVNDLGDRVSDLCKVVIVQGTDPDKPERFESRSHALFFVCCELVRAEIDDDTIFSIITDPEFRISASVLDKGSSVVKYAIRQIGQARENAIDKDLQKLNSRYAVVTIGGKQRVVYEQKDEVLNRHRLVTMTFEDFQKKYMNRLKHCGEDAKGNPRYIPKGKWWLSHKNRRQYEQVIFAPGKDIPGAYNMWRGFAVESRPGNGHELFLGHILNNICGGQQELFDYTMGWLATAVQRPGYQGETALVLRGDQGVGKGFLARTMGHLFGRHFLHVSDAMHLTGIFNVHLRDCALLFADEAFYAGDKRHASTLKRIVTERSLMVTPKGIDSEMKANCLHIIMASNDDWVVPAGMKERRFAVLDVGKGNIQDSKYFGEIQEALNDGGYANLLHHLLTYDLDNFDVRNLPKTKALRDQKVRSLGPMEDWWYHKLEEGRLMAHHDAWTPTVLAIELMDDYIMYCRTFNITSKRGSPTALGRFLNSKVCPELKKRQGGGSVVYQERTLQRPYYYTFPGLDVVREYWDEKFGGSHEWPQVESMDQPDSQEKIPF
jgi:hypothetical protein